MVTVLTRTIGPSGRDYASFTLAEADVENIGTSADLVANDEAIVFEADAGTYNESVTFSSTLVCDATRNVTYKPAAGSEHSGVPGDGVHLTSSTITLAIQQDYLTLEGLSAFSNGSTVIWQPNGIGTTVRNCIGETDGPYTGMFCGKGDPAAPSRWQNCVTLTSGTAQGFRFLASGSSACYAEIYNCTSKNRQFEFESRGPACVVDVVNCLALGNSFRQFTSGGGAVTLTGSNNFGGSSDPWPASLQGSPYPITPTTSFSTPLGSGDYAVYMGATGALADVTGNDVWQQGVGPASNSDVPTTDINGVTRSGSTCNPGAFEADGFVAPTVLTRTIGSGKDYSTFTLAEAAVTGIGSGIDLTFYNEAIVFEADAGTYPESVTFSSALTKDATRQVTYRPASGAGHNGVFESGVDLTGMIQGSDDHTAFEDIQFSTTATTVNLVAGKAVFFRRCLALINSGHYSLCFVRNATQTEPVSFEDCVFKFVSGTNGVAPTTANASLDAATRFINCTVIGTQDPASTGAFRQIYSPGSTAVTEIINCIVLTGGPAYSETPGGTLVVTGSNNFGGSTNPFPAALQGSPYPITATTNTSPGAGDWAIYQASNGQLYNIVANDVWQQGVGPTANSDVPATDILGYARYGATANPGAFELGLPVPGIRVKPRHFQVNTAATAHAVSVWQPQLRKL